MKKKLSLILATLIAVIGVSSSAMAVTLAQSFSSNSDYNCTRVAVGGSYYTKTTWAKTVGYTARHYVWAYIGGTSSSADKAIADSGKVYGSGDIKATATVSNAFVASGVSPNTCFPTGYGKYGT